MRWEKGRAQIDALIAASELQRVAPSRTHADRLLDQAARHLVSCRAVTSNDPEAAYSLLYTAARKALAAILANEGLRTTSRGGHVALHQAVVAQLVPPMGDVLRPFDRMRRNRNELEYPPVDAPEVDEADIAADLPKVEAIVALALRLLDDMAPY